MIENPDNNKKPYKIILVGSQAVGKTSLLLRIIQSKFDENYASTIGVDFKTVMVPVGHKIIALQIWDTAGQQKFKALTQTYYKGAHSCICVYDISQKQSLRKAEQFIKQAFEYKIKPDCIYLLANKSDKIDSSDQNKCKQYQENGRQLANRLQINFLKVSAKTGTGLGTILGDLASKIDKVYGNSKQHDSIQINRRPNIRIDEQGNGKKCGC